jgi:hypothetical protein
VKWYVISECIQVLREINEAKVASYILKKKARETIRVINRDVVDAEKQLREGQNE